MADLLLAADDDRGLPANLRHKCLCWLPPASSQAAGDLPTLLTASRALLRLFAAGPGEEERAGKQREYVERKAGELAAATAAAEAAPCHAALLAWQPVAAK